MIKTWDEIAKLLDFGIGLTYFNDGGRLLWYVEKKKTIRTPIYIQQRYFRLFRGFLFPIGDKK